MHRPPIFRPATMADADFMAQLIDQAGEGMSMAVWAMLAEKGQTALDAGPMRIRGNRSWISWRNG